MIDPFNEVPECFDESLVLHNYSDDKSLCYLDHEKLRAARAYFSVGCLNAAYIVLTTTIFVYFAGRTTASKSQLTNKSNIQSEDWQRVLYNWRRSSLRKRSIFGTLVGAIGHLLLSTSLLLAQAFYTFISCEIYTWGVILGVFTWLYAYCWRAFRLNYLLRLNKLKTQFANWMQNQTLNRGAQQDHVDYEEFMRYKEGYFYRVSYAAYAIILIVFAIVCVFTEVFALRRHHPECKAKWGVLIIAAVLGAFFLVITPITIWQLRRTKDLHGIRTELMIDVAVGLPCYILMLVWFGFYGRLIPAETGSYYKFFFSPANWSIVFTSAAHVTSVVFPLIQVLYRNRRGKNAKAKIAAIPHRQQDSDSHDDDDDGFDDTMNRISTRVDSKPCPCMHLQSPRTLQQLLSNPKTLKELLQLSIQDFSSENVLFYEAYLKLVDKVKRRDADFHPIFWFPWLRSSTTLIIPDIDQFPEQVSLFTEPIRDENLLADFSEFYCTYIRESAPLQVNISCEARCELDLYFRSLKLSTLASKLSRLTETSHRWSSVHSSNSASAVAGGQGPKGTPPSLTAEDGSRRTSISSTNRSASAVVEICNPPLTLAMFEPARKEVFWNIFASVYPKYIAKENKFNTRCAQCCGR